MASASALQAANESGLDDLVGYNLKRVYMIFQSDFRETLEVDGLSPRSYSTLSIAIHRPHVTQSELARELGIERSGLVAIVDQLEDLGLVARTRVPGDRRVQAISPTQKGQDVYADASRRAEEHEARLLACLDDDERTSLIETLKKLRRLSGEKK